MKIEVLRKLADREEVDYQFLMAALVDYSRPREKISRWLKTGELIRVKKGLYVFGEAIRQSPYSLEILANLIYGPSAISMTYALAFYGLIPERVSLITSITNMRNKKFSTSVGNFNYYYLQSKKYSVGITVKPYSNDRQFFIATAEKALCDQIYLIDKEINFYNSIDVEHYLLSDLRVDEMLLKKFDLNLLKQIVKTYNHKNLKLLEKFFEGWK